MNPKIRQKMKRHFKLLLCLLMMMFAGFEVKAQGITITLAPGWNWISYPNNEVMDLATALGDFVPVEDDIIKAQSGYSVYRDGEWVGSLRHFEPGVGYMYYSNRMGMASFVFAGGAPQLTVTTIPPTDITLVSAVSGGSITLNDGNYVYVLLKGICWATHPNPMVMSDSFTESGNGPDAFTAEMTDLTPNTLYYVRAYAVTLDDTTYGEEVSFTTLWPVAINGLFSVSSSQQVYFSQGNLQYKASNNTWRFATNQYDYIGDANSNISSSYNGWIDLFGWGTSGWNCGNTYYRPWDYYGNGSLYGPPGSYNLTGNYINSDWGYYNSISNGGNQTHQWRTLTHEEWVYVFNTRTTTSGIRYAKAKVNNVNGVILLPDNWSSSTYSLSNTNQGSASFSSNTISSSQWSTLENAGAVFLPAAGNRNGTSVSYVGSYGFYWSSSYGDAYYACYVLFSDSSLYTDYYYYRHYGRSVRLVRSAQ